ncbi:metal-sensing transcriptional repressor [Silvanigrella paludirubra]|uniref:Metal-sensing transcriptional repressor n=1 Tax=Silvanigrella paludirubra TaxID=2499159 RepID=A0A6N6VU19_9BACT|nr:metal/formaldehyde-sensitive transcriptional repressor [Silvanigrella paludirubra]KAB8039683.1 metal-sensing transcriptional repressor [Silvanigrella paludirubra]
MSSTKKNKLKHIITNKDKLISRVKKIKGQLEGVEKSLENDQDCKKILHIISSIRGALGGLMAEVMESHIINHMEEDKETLTDKEIKMAQELVESLKVFMK